MPDGNGQYNPKWCKEKRAEIDESKHSITQEGGSKTWQIQQTQQEL